MKKHPVLFSFLSLLFCLSGCSSEQNNFTDEIKNKVLLKKSEEISNLVLLTTKEQVFDVTRYEDCILFCSLPGCSHCKTERTKLEKYISETQCIIYEVSRNVYVDCYDDESNSVGSYAYMYPRLTGYPDYLFYKEGKLKDSHIGELGNDYDSFKEELSKKVTPINIYLANDYKTGLFNSITYAFFQEEDSYHNPDSLLFKTNKLESIIKKENSVVLFSYKKCPDCTLYRQEVLLPYLLENRLKKIFLFELEGYYQLKNSSDAAEKKTGLSLWSSFSNRFQLIDEGFYHVDQYQNKAGYVPTVCQYQQGEFLSKDVFLNEEDIIRKEDGTLSYQKAFHKECLSFTSNTKVKEKDTSSSEYTKALKELKEKALKADKEFAIAFLNQVL